MAVDLRAKGPQGVAVRTLLGPAVEAVFPETLSTPSALLPLREWVAGTDSSVWTHPSPTRFDHKNYRETPPGTALLKPSGEPIPYCRSLANTGECSATASCWEVEAGVVYFRGDNTDGLSLRHEPTLRDSNRRSFAHAGLPPWAFVDWTASIDSLTREALLVPTDGRVTIPVALPSHPRLRFGFGAPAPRLQALPDQPVGRLLIGEEVVWTHTTETDAPWSEHTIDLGRYAGQTVSLTFEATAATAGVQHSVVAFAEPTIITNDEAPRRPRRVVMVGIDTLRLDHLGLHGAPSDRTPGLDARGRTGVVFDNAWAPAPRTRPSFRSALTGLWPLDAIGAPPLTRRFADAGFATAGIVANVHLQPHLGFADGAGWWDYHDSDDAGPQVDRAIAWLNEHAHEDSFLFLHLMDPHIFYLAPEPFTDVYSAGIPRAKLPDRYNRWTIQESMEKGTLKPAHKRFMQARYQGEVRYLDQQLSRLLAHLDTLPGDTLVVLHSDHGEEFWDHGGYEHNHTLYPELMRVMLWVIPPAGWADGPARVSAPVSLVDLTPTLVDLFELPQHGLESSPGVSLAPWLDPAATTAQAALAETLHKRPLQMGHMMFNREQWGVVHAGWAYTLETISGREEAYRFTIDPTHSKNAIQEAPVSTLRQALSEATGWPVSAGWRIRIERPKQPFSLTFEEPVSAAGVLDPEAARTRRANLEWGEVPPRRPADVAEVTVSPDRRTVHVRPGSQPSGTLYVLGPSPTSTARVDAPETPTYTVRPGNRMLGRAKAEIKAGTILVPTHGEGAALAEIGDPRLIEALQTMGYIE